MKKKIFVLVFMLLVLPLFVNAKTVSYRPKDGFVPDAQTAVKIAEAVWLPIYGENAVLAGRPFETKLNEDGTWTVGCVLHVNASGGVSRPVLCAAISKENGSILNVSYGAK